MDSVKPTEIASNWENFYASELDREKEDEENLAFYDEREQLARKEVKQARDDVRDLEIRKGDLQEEVNRCKRLQRTEKKFWQAGDEEFFDSVQGSLVAAIKSLLPAFLA